MEPDNKSAEGEDSNNQAADDSNKFVLAKHTVIQPLSSAINEDNNNSGSTELAQSSSQPHTNQTAAPVNADIQKDVTPGALSSNSLVSETLNNEAAANNAANITLAEVNQPPVASGQPTASVDTAVQSVMVVGGDTQPVQDSNVNQGSVVVGGQADSVPAATAVVSSNPTGVLASMDNKTDRKLSVGMWAVIIASVVIVGGAVAALVLLGTNNNSPSAVFNDALVNSLSTTKMEQDATQQGITGKLLLDATNASRPVIDVAATVNIFGINLELDGWGNTQDGFIKYDMSGQGQVSNSTMNKWAQTEKNGQLVSGVSSSEQSIFDPYTAIFSQWITGNFSSAQRKSLAAYASSNHVYNYNSKNVISGNIGGQSVYVYDVTVNNSALKGMISKAENMLGLTSKEDAFISSNQALPTPDTATVYIYKSSKQIAKAVFHDKTSGNITNVYSFGSLVQVPSMPKAQINFSDIASQFNSIYGGTSSSASN